MQGFNTICSQTNFPEWGTRSQEQTGISKERLISNKTKACNLSHIEGPNERPLTSNQTEFQNFRIVKDIFLTTTNDVFHKYKLKRITLMEKRREQSAPHLPLISFSFALHISSADLTNRFVISSTSFSSFLAASLEMPADTFFIESRVF